MTQTFTHDRQHHSTATLPAARPGLDGPTAAAQCGRITDVVARHVAPAGLDTQPRPWIQ